MAAVVAARNLTSQAIRYILTTKRDMSQKLSLNSGEYIAYHHTPGSYPGVVFLPGLMSHMNGTKAVALERYCRSVGRSYTRFDHRGLGQSSGKPEECTIGSRKEDVLSLLRVIEGPQVLVGSSLGGWIMLLVAMAAPDRIIGLVGIATAVDFLTRRFDNLPIEIKNEIKTSGKWTLPSQYSSEPYVLTWQMVEEARKHVLDGTIAAHCPVRLIHGMKDEEVPYSVSLDVAERLESENVQVTLIKDGAHRLSEPKNLNLITKTLEELIVEINDTSSKI